MAKNPENLVNRIWEDVEGNRSFKEVVSDTD